MSLPSDITTKPQQSSTADVIIAAEKATSARYAADRVAELMDLNDAQMPLQDVRAILRLEAEEAEASYKAHQKSRG